jgi:type I restriction enzyme S subunit
LINAELNLENLPEEWLWASFEEIVETFDGQRVPVSRTERAKRNGDFPYYGASGIIDSIDGYLFDGNYLLIAEDGANLLSRSTPIAFEASGKFWVNNHAHIIQSKQNLIPLEFLRDYLNSIDLTPYVSGSAQPKLNQKNLNRVPVPLPPFNEQRRIVEKIEALTARSRKAREALEAIPELLDQFRQSVLAAAFRGDLTADWREQNPDVEPAEALLERIRVERRKRWEEAELEKMRVKGKEPTNEKWKAKYKEPETVDLSELPELPTGWTWASAMQACEEVFLGLTSALSA